jgi:hypothetical protein
MKNGGDSIHYNGGRNATLFNMWEWRDDVEAGGERKVTWYAEAGIPSLQGFSFHEWATADVLCNNFVHLLFRFNMFWHC